MGEILAALKRLKLEEKTLVIWTSDNGAPNRNPPQGSNAPYRGWGYNTSEGAMRMPMIARWPGKVPAGRECRELCSMLDILPTFASLAEAALPKQPIDGHDIRRILLDEAGAKSEADEQGFYYYHIDQLQAVRSGPWKLYLPLRAKRMNLATKRAPSTLQLYNVRDDITEVHELSASHPEIVERLLKLAEMARTQIGDEDKPGLGQRPAGFVEKPTARIKGP